MSLALVGRHILKVSSEWAAFTIERWALTPLVVNAADAMNLWL